MDPLFIKVLKQWIPLAITTMAICFIIYLVLQQAVRMGGNEPQIQMAEDTATALNAGRTLPAQEKIDVGKSLSVFTILYDQKGNITYSNAELNGSTPELPSGVLTDKKGTSEPGESRITWQPQKGVRLATVVVKYNDGYVLVGRNMREIENLSQQQFDNILLGCILTLFSSLISIALLQALFRRNK